MTLSSRLDSASRDAIRAALVASHGNVRAASLSLAVSYATLQREIGRLGLRPWLTESYPRAVRQGYG